MGNKNLYVGIYYKPMKGHYSDQLRAGVVSGKEVIKDPLSIHDTSKRYHGACKLWGEMGIAEEIEKLIKKRKIERPNIVVVGNGRKRDCEKTTWVCLGNIVEGVFKGLKHSKMAVRFEEEGFINLD